MITFSPELETLIKDMKLCRHYMTWLQHCYQLVSNCDFMAELADCGYVTFDGKLPLRAHEFTFYSAGTSVEASIIDLRRDIRHLRHPSVLAVPVLPFTDKPLAMLASYGTVGGAEVLYLAKTKIFGRFN